MSARGCSPSEADNSVLLSIVQLLAGSDHPFQQPFYLAAVKKPAASSAAQCARRPISSILRRLPSGAVELLIGGVGEMYPQLHMVAGPPESAEEFAKVWTRERGGHWRRSVQLDAAGRATVRPPAAAPGRLRLAEETDLTIVREWARAYARETNAHIDVTAFYERRVRKQSLYLWDDAGAKCMVAEANKTPNSVSISGVYTPDAFRNRGYASNAVASATQRALDRGCKFCALFADRELATPMRIYRSVGYRPLRDHLYIDLVR